MCLWHDVKLRKTQLEVRSLTATWSRDLWGHRVVVFLEMCQIVGWTAMANLAALRAAVFSLSAKNLRGGGVEINPPPVRGLIISHVSWAPDACYRARQSGAVIRLLLSAHQLGVRCLGYKKTRYMVASFLAEGALVYETGTASPHKTPTFKRNACLPVK